MFSTPQESKTGKFSGIPNSPIYCLNCIYLISDIREMDIYHYWEAKYKSETFKIIIRTKSNNVSWGGIPILYRDKLSSLLKQLLEHLLDQLLDNFSLNFKLIEDESEWYSRIFSSKKTKPTEKKFLFNFSLIFNCFVIIYNIFWSQVYCFLFISCL